MAPEVLDLVVGDSFSSFCHFAVVARLDRLLLVIWLVLPKSVLVGASGSLLPVLIPMMAIASVARPVVVLKATCFPFWL